MLPSGIMSQHGRTINIGSPSDTGKDPIRIVIEVSAMIINLFKKYSQSSLASISMTQTES